MRSKKGYQNIFIVGACRPLDSLQNGTFNYSKPSLAAEGIEIYPVGIVASSTCDTNYIRLGSELRTCQNNGNWSGETSVCNTISK